MVLKLVVYFCFYWIIYTVYNNIDHGNLFAFYKQCCIDNIVSDFDLNKPYLNLF